MKDNRWFAIACPPGNDNLAGKDMTTLVAVPKLASRIQNLLTLALVVLALAATFSLNAAESKPTRLNVLFIIADDQNCQLGCYGNRVVKTPNIDRLASLGVRFDRAYCNYPVCNASRTSFLSGRFPDTTKVFGNGTQPRVALGQTYQFLPEYFRAQGRFTAGIGKIAHGTFADLLKWDVFTDPMHGGGQDEDDQVAQQPRQGKARRGGAGKAKARAESKADSVPFGWQATDNQDEEEPDGITARRVARLIEEHKNKPFFIAAGFHKPHVPHVAPKKYFDMYSLEQMPVPVEPPGHAKNIPAIARPPKDFPDLTDQQKREIIQHYYAATTFMDAQVGVLLETMDRLKLWDNTVVVFLGDHGWHHGEHDGFWAKMSIMEESARAPLIVCAPGRKSHATSPRLVEFVDIFPTLTELCGLPQQDGVEGLSFAPLLDRPERPWKKGVFSVVTRRGGLGRSVRTEQFTYIEWPDSSTQLYDYTRDPKEYYNLVKNPEHAKTAAELKHLLKNGWQAARPLAN